MSTTKASVPEFRAGLADYIASDGPAVVTCGGRTVGIFIPTPEQPRSASQRALAHADAKLKAVMPLDDDEFDVLVKDFDDARKAAKVGRREERPGIGRPSRSESRG